MEACRRGGGERKAETQIETKGIQALGGQDGLVRLCRRKGTEPGGVRVPSRPVPVAVWAWLFGEVGWQHFLSARALSILRGSCTFFTGKNPVNPLLPETLCEQIPWIRKGSGPSLGPGPSLRDGLASARREEAVCPSSGLACLPSVRVASLPFPGPGPRR